MAAVAITDNHKGWNGDIRRNRVSWTVASASTDSMTPASVGLNEIYAIVPTGRIGTFDGVALVAASNITWNKTSDIVIGYDVSSSALSSGNIEAFIFGK